MKESENPKIRRTVVLKLLSSAAVVSPLTIAATLQMGYPAMAGSCTATATSLCTGAASGGDVTQVFSYGAPVDVTTDPGFGLSVTGGGYGMSLSGQGGTSFVDDYSSTISTDGDYGIAIENDISGDLTIVSTGLVTSTGAGGDGIRATNYGADTVVRAHDAQGDNNGILVDHHGTGAVQIFSTGSIIGNGTDGIYAYGASGTDMTIEAVDTQGVAQGIWGSNWGTGFLSITSTGLATGTGGDGIRADNYGTDVTVTAADTHGSDLGIFVQHFGTGVVLVDSTGKATGDLTSGITVYTDAASTSTSTTINAVDTEGGLTGMLIQHFGTGALLVNSTGTAIGNGSNAIAIETDSGSTSLEVNVNNAQGDDNGVSTIHESAVGTPGNDATITVNGHVSGGSGYGIVTESLVGVLTNIHVEAGAVVESTAGNGISNGDADSNVDVDAAGTVNGRVDLGLGSDTMTLRGSLSGITVLNGGGGGTDVLNVSAVTSATHVGSDIQGWSEINLDNSRLRLTGGSIVVGTPGDMTTGIFLQNGSTLDGRQDNLSLDGNLSLAAGTRLLAAGDGSGSNTITGDVVNAGTITASDGGAGDSIRIDGDYTGNGGTVILETRLGDDTSVTDQLDIGGSTSGTSTVNVRNSGGTGAPTNEGIEIIKVGGTSAGTFTLQGNYHIGSEPVVVVGAYSYRLFKGNRTGTETDNWYLRSQFMSTTGPGDPDPDPDTDDPDTDDPGTGDPGTGDPGTGDPDTEDPGTGDPDTPFYQPGVPLYEVYPQALLGLNAMSTLQQRFGNRLWLNDGSLGATGAGQEQFGSASGNAGIWARIEGARDSIDPHVSTARSRFDQNIFKLQTGMDGALFDDADGTLIAGIAGHYTRGIAEVYSMHGDGQIATSGYGIGGTLTWYGEDGLYIDSQAQATWYETDIRSRTAGRSLVNDNDAFGYALSLEGGKRVAISQGWSVTPQAQLVYSHMDFDRFVDAFGTPVSLDRAASLQGRLGLTLDRETSWRNADGLIERAHGYGIANVYYEFLDGSRVDVAGENFDFRKDRVWGGLGLGGSYNWNDDRYSLYAEGLINTSLEHIGASYALQGKAGLRVKW